MATNIKDLATQFQGFQTMMKQDLDELANFKCWRGAVDESMGVLMNKMDVAATRLLRLEHALPPPPPNGPEGVIDPNTALQPSTWPSVSSSPQPHNQEVSGGVLGGLPRLASGLNLDSALCGLEGDHEMGTHHSLCIRWSFPS